MTYAETLGVLMSSWAIGYILGFKLRQISDALSAA